MLAMSAMSLAKPGLMPLAAGLEPDKMRKLKIIEFLPPCLQLRRRRHARHPNASDRQRQRFLATRDAINPLMARYGFPLVPYRVRPAWLAGAADPTRSTETFFKLLYRGRGKPFIFSGYVGLCLGFEKLKSLRWPSEVSVMPSTGVIFWGFDVHPGDTDRVVQRVEKLLKALPEPNPSRAIVFSVAPIRTMISMNN